ncbi:hypothetical protein ACS0TY_003352 [Phlomoides rotata]
MSSSMMIMSINMAIPSKPPAAAPNSLPIKISKLHRISSTTSTHRSLKCSNANPKISTTTRRSGNYNPSLWDFNYIQSLSSEYRADRYLNRVTELVAQVKMMLEKETESIPRLELIDMLQNLGISYHFEDNIKQILSSLHQQKCFEGERDLYSTALMFRLFRQHSFSVSQDVFDSFKNEKGEFKASLEEDTKGLLQLYEASFLLTEGEETLEAATLFSTNLLHRKVDDGLIEDKNLSLMVRRALEVPLHWSIQKINARWFIDAYASNFQDIINPIVLHLAKLDFNILQHTYQDEIKQASGWWENTGLARKLPFARDRVVECFLWALGPLFQPQYGNARIVGTKVNLMITVIDDMCDVYCTLEEVLLFNQIIQRWDIEAIDKLPDYMQICFLALNNLVNEIAFDVLKEEGSFIVPYLRKSWADICRAYAQEARWYSEGYTPSMEEYMNNAWYTSGPTVMLSHEFFLLKHPIQEEAVQSVYEYHNIVRYSAVILRLINDLGTSQDEMERGDVPKSVQCYMNETGASMEEAKEYVRCLVRETWKKMNKEGISGSNSKLLSDDFVTSAMDLARFTHFMYQHGDGHGVQDLDFKHRISTLLFHPIN